MIHRRQASSPVCRLIAGLPMLGLLPGFFLCTPAQAHRHDFPFTYDWKQPAHGEQEFEAHTTYLKSDASFEEEVEYEYGVSKRFSIAPYVVFGRGRDESLHYTGFQLEARYQLTKYRTNRVLAGLYEEYAKPKDEAAALESRLILSRYDENGGDISFNYVVTNGFRADTDFEKTYSIGYARPFGRSKYDLRGGGEWIHSLHDGRINAGPVLGLRISDHISLVAGYAFALNRRAGNSGEFRMITEYEF